MNTPSSALPSHTLVDKFGRHVDYVRISVTDRCDFRCVYCMAEDMTFVPRQQVLSLEELALVADAFTELGVKRIRLTGGEPLVRKNILSLIEHIGGIASLDELTLTTNGSQLQKYAGELKAKGVKRINISLDSLDPQRFKQLTRTGDLQQVLKGIDSAIAAGFERIKINAVILKGRNEHEVLDLVNFACDKGIDIAFIEEMPLGLIDEHNRQLSFYSSDEIQQQLSQQHTLSPIDEHTGGPSRYYALANSHTRVGFISPHSHNFCHLCNRVRVTAEGRLLLCLGNEHSVDLRAIIRNGGDKAALKQTIIAAMDLKPERHHFELDDSPQILRFMNMTGG
ncbi:GTP 3',8-cyclase MoaA [Dasania sp. GY-MA-18]|uniref:GTP 3',8-cyclase n=1 Tax=Dasania phycosphaerae TaxID=2950436 RepID=A0A9J6RKY7_9GAMM|nr:MULTISPECIES: GTP 3',8-cyclase MoaA [Dasania]MCR8922233.1 GTP 3',8-cyclase MoaA [Dasania sp. GY-MA-18]MCZ0864661.1 GTP 3',8-cyclase MoaA [Dasania phycosphaerae]MCZ0868389.1 GTP 3',8-cyclase MoaA [Dasania phycosphaerae]